MAGSGTQISGKDVLEDVFGQPRNINAWGMFGVLVLWVFFFRFVHYLLFLRASAPFLKKETTKPASSKQATIPAKTGVTTTDNSVTDTEGKKKDGKALYEMVAQTPNGADGRAPRGTGVGALEDVV